MTSPIAGSVLPIKRAEELILTLPGVISARIIAGDSGAIDQIHVLATSEVTPKQMVRNIESALIAHLAMRIDHRKISVATTNETKPKLLEPESKPSAPVQAGVVEGQQSGASAPRTGPFARRFYFEDVEVRGSRSKGLSCRVTLRKGSASYIGEALGIEGDRSRVELAARATLLAIADADNREGQLGVQGVKVFDAFERTFVFVAVSVRSGRENKVLTGSVEMRESAESAGVLAVLDATNRWIEHN
ncbi:MAG: hypothetical protein Q7S20_03220 [Gemmatimonadaceae bacterium]|nr:hypothetical protein [Gemmatimonadaceae bacterium]